MHSGRDLGRIHTLTLSEDPSPSPGCSVGDGSTVSVSTGGQSCWRVILACFSSTSSPCSSHIGTGCFHLYFSPRRSGPLVPPCIITDPSCFKVFEQPETQHNFLLWASVQLLLQSLQQGPCSPEFCDHKLWGSHSPSDQRTAQDHFQSIMWLSRPGQMEAYLRSCSGGHPKADRP